MSDKYNDIHELEIIFLKSDNKLPLPELHTELTKHHFTLIDDAYFLDRNDFVEPWQSPDIAMVSLLNGSDELRLSNQNEVWDALKVEYLFANTPYKYVELLLDTIFQLAIKVNLSVLHNEKLVTKHDLLVLFEKYKYDVINFAGGEPGSEIVGITIQSTYPR